MKTTIIRNNTDLEKELQRLDDAARHEKELIKYAFTDIKRDFINAKAVYRFIGSLFQKKNPSENGFWTFIKNLLSKSP